MINHMGGIILLIVSVATLLVGLAIFSVILRKKGSSKLSFDDICDLFTIAKFFKNKNTQAIVNRLSKIGSHFEKLDKLNTHDPLYCKLTLVETDVRPFISLTEAKKMVDGKVSINIGVDDEVRGIIPFEWENTPQDMAEVIAMRIGVQVTSSLEEFAIIAYDMRSHVYTFNKSKGDEPTMLRYGLYGEMSGQYFITEVNGLPVWINTTSHIDQFNRKYQK
jgi:hypothetical protein|tara:strand:- start:2322 stop:2981 length:660 start_codon:yes stop_codon:yes gene_type:complete